ncbi:MAG: endonuclease/exonuclease/phosphatase family protein [Acutalibacteraceae bacterium]
MKTKNKRILIAVSVVLLILLFCGVFLLNFFGIGGVSQEKIAEDVPLYDFKEKTDDVVRAMTFNVRCTNVGKASMYERIDIVSDTILNSEADSIGIQEATPSWMRALKNTVDDKYAFVGEGRDGGDSGEYSAILYLKDKYNLVDSGTFWLSQTPDVPSKSWDAAFNRICTWAILENKETHGKYIHINSHFDHIGEEARAQSVKMILEKANEYKDLPVVFTADMNVCEGTENYLQFTSDGGLTDTKYIAENTMEFCTFHNLDPLGENEGNVIDYVMVNEFWGAKEYRVVTAGIDGAYVSDHFPVYADIYIKQ